MGVVLPVIDEDEQTSQWAAKCLQAHENLHRWSQMAAWMGEPSRNGEPDGWSQRGVGVQPAVDLLLDGDVADMERSHGGQGTRGHAGRRIACCGGPRLPASAVASRGTTCRDAKACLGPRRRLRCPWLCKRMHPNPNSRVTTQQTPSPFLNLRHLGFRESSPPRIALILPLGRRS
ncbi:unnamed protein product [Lampetra fluviatilis]